MRRFKTRKISKLKRIRLILFAILIISLMLFIKLFKNKIQDNSENIKNLTYIYLGLTPKKQETKSEKLVKIENSEQIQPIIYIYNTHQTENYAFNNLESYNIDYNVYFAGQILASYLKPYALVENQNISEILNNNNFTYSESYKASRILLEQRKIEIPSLNYYIDLHRDSAPYEYTTCDYNNKKYARLMFILGGENSNYTANEEFMNKLNEHIKSINDCLSRGILKKEGEGVNGLYNQDFSPNSILIEVGGQYNSIDEVNNTLELFAKVYLEEIGITL